MTTKHYLYDGDRVEWADRMVPMRLVGGKRLPVYNMEKFFREAMPTEAPSGGPDKQEDTKKPATKVAKSEAKFGVKTDRLPGGKGDRHVPADFNSEALAEGVRHEMEHTSDPALAREIAIDHMTEDLDYYAKLRAMGQKPKRPARKPRATRDRNKHGHRDDLVPGMTLAAKGVHGGHVVTVLDDGAYMCNGVEYSCASDLLHGLHGHRRHNTTMRRYFGLET